MAIPIAYSEEKRGTNSSEVRCLNSNKINIHPGVDRSGCFISDALIYCGLNLGTFWLLRLSSFSL